MATANGSLCNISGYVSKNGSMVGCMESDIDQATVESIQAWIAYLLIPLNMISILANLLVILAVTRTSHLQEPAHKLIANLAVADFLMGVQGIFVESTTFLIEFPPKIICLGHVSLVTLWALASTNSLIVINIDRFIAISRPLHYYQIVTPRVILVMVVLAWSFAFFASVMTLIGNRWQPDQPCMYDTVTSRTSLICSSLVIGTCGVAIISIYAYMMMIAKPHQQQIQQEPSSSGSQEAVATGKSFSVELAKHLKLAKTFGIVVGAVFVCWVPYIIMMLLSIADVYHDTVGVARGLGYLLAYSNSCMNFFIYAAKSSQFRVVFRAVLSSRGH
ncbi:PREDICTED: alpha-1A adrenergic receptor-like [Priapulus caudatus]|uniref:Alpha-1A adrenergic receptor-like n=1 Tax=Priapulus caudatus TaxID=37621 RepID=A0ABM1F1H7_PRICU|nr:PREDICTED: alpha-1A adrenergic receptor-like [Priapulus caudatus]